jgi:DNA polymerase-3 subunit gamma/tau
LVKKALELDLMLPVCTIFGPSGVGKTTIARLIGMWTCCTKRVENEPCGSCANCAAILNNSHPDVFELDGGTYTGVSSINTMLENIDYEPLLASKRIYILDECHMLSRHSMSSLLKRFEEDLTKVQFILATTNVEKLPFTILSRSFQVELNYISNDKITEYLESLATINSISIENEACNYIANASCGSMRQAISLFEQLNILYQKNITADETIKMLGISPDSLVKQLVNFMLTGEVQKIIETLHKVKNIIPANLVKQVLQEIHHRIYNGHTSQALIQAGYDLAKSSVIMHKSPFSDQLISIILTHAALKAKSA